MEGLLSELVGHICKVLVKYQIRYLIVGGTAVALHGYFRKSTNESGIPIDKYDLDFWYQPTYTNYFHLLDAFDELGYDVEEFRSETVPNPKKSFFKFETERFTIDFLPELKGDTKFNSSFKNRETVWQNGTEIWFMAFDDLIKEKSVDARPNDIIDIEQLRTKRNG